MECVFRSWKQSSKFSVEVFFNIMSQSKYDICFIYLFIFFQTFFFQQTIVELLLFSYWTLFYWLVLERNRHKTGRWCLLLTSTWSSPCYGDNLSISKYFSFVDNVSISKYFSFVNFLWCMSSDSWFWCSDHIYLYTYLTILHSERPTP